MPASFLNLPIITLSTQNKFRWLNVLVSILIYNILSCFKMANIIFTIIQFVQKTSGNRVFSCYPRYLDKIQEYNCRLQRIIE